MILKTGQGSLKLPPIGLINCVYLRGSDGVTRRIEHRRADEVFRMRKDSPDLRGIPVYFTDVDDGLLFFPAADTDVEVIVRFYPPMMEI